MRLALCVVWGLVSISSVARGDSVAVIGMNHDGKSVFQNVDRAQYVSNLSTVILETRQSVIHALAKRSCEAPSPQGWVLNSVTVGIGAGIEAGLGPLLNAGAKARFRLVFSPSANPEFPD